MRNFFRISFFSTFTEIVPALNLVNLNFFEFFSTSSSPWFSFLCKKLVKLFCETLGSGCFCVKCWFSDSWFSKISPLLQIEHLCWFGFKARGADSISEDSIPNFKSIKEFWTASAKTSSCTRVSSEVFLSLLTLYCAALEKKNSLGVKQHWFWKNKNFRFCQLNHEIRNSTWKQQNKI